MLSHECHDSSNTVSAVTVSIKVTASAPQNLEHFHSSHQAQNFNPAAMAGDTGLLECPMCDFTVLPTDDYILQLHFEQVHTTDSPFIIEDDQEPPLPTQPRPTSDAEGTPSSDEDEDDSTVRCTYSDCNELVPLIDFNDHLDFHAAESLSFDETTGKYRSHHSSTTMQTLAMHQSHTALSKSSSADYNSTTNQSEAPSKHGERGHRLKKRRHRPRSNTNSSEKSTLSRSIITFNPFTKLDKSIKPPNKSARLGASVASSSLTFLWLMDSRNPNWDLMHGKNACPDGCMTNSLRVLRSSSSTALAGTAA
jgi:hypothetical protein